MNGEIEEINQVMFCRDGTRKSFIEMISKLDLKPPVIIKPNWSTSKIFTEAEVLDWTLSALNCDKIVVESYAHYRSPIFLDLDGPIDAAFEKKIAGQKKNDLRENDEWFLELSGIGDILQKHDVEYLNLSEELWSKRVCEPDQIKSLVKSRFEPLVNDNMYSMVPTRLYDMRGCTLLSLAKPKLAHGTIGVTMSVKNLFGMISTPYRGKFHGSNDTKLNDSITDITKICQSLFDLRGVVEAVFSTSTFEESLMMGQIFRDLGFIWGSNNIFELDAVVTTQLGLDAQKIEHLSLAARTFGQWSQQAINLAAKNLIDLQ
ncbi:MAG: DUF362 domain-containing protein [Candidatus Thorarchaeota archaeon]|jgi:uncharacterized protein (DUF362 family)